MPIETKDVEPTAAYNEATAHAFVGMALIIRNVMLHIPEAAAQSKGGRQVILDSLRGIHNALAHHLGSIERMMHVTINPSDLAELQRFIDKDRDFYMKEGIAHAIFHETSPAGATCDYCPPSPPGKPDPSSSIN